MSPGDAGEIVRADDARGGIPGWILRKIRDKAQRKEDASECVHNREGFIEPVVASGSQNFHPAIRGQPERIYYDRKPTGCACTMGRAGSPSRRFLFCQRLASLL